MKFRTRKMIRTMVAALAISGTLIGGSVALAANSSSGTVAVLRGGEPTEVTNKSVVKSNETGKAAKITVNDSISYNDSLSVYVKNKNDNIVSVESAVFRGTTRATTQSLPYKDGKGKKGNPFYPVFSLAQSSLSSSLTVNFIFQA